MARSNTVAVASSLLRFLFMLICIGGANASSSPNSVERSTRTTATGSTILLGQRSWILFQLIFIYTTTLPQQCLPRIAALFLLEIYAILAASCVLEELNTEDILGQALYVLFMSFKLMVVLGCLGILKLPRCGICNNENCDGSCGVGPSSGGDDANA